MMMRLSFSLRTGGTWGSRQISSFGQDFKGSMAATDSSTLVQIMEKLSIDVSKNKDLKKEIDDIVSGGVLTET